jgi:hypothetical protein
MAEELLVDDQIDNGQMIVDQLLADGFDVTVAFWAKHDEGFWRMYIASPAFDDRKPGPNYLTIRDSLGKLPDPEVRFWPINLINDENPMARQALQIAGRPGKTEGIRYRGTRLGDLPIEEAYIYPRPAVPLRQEFTISYVRQGESNEWVETTRKGELHRWVRPKGVVSTAHGPGDMPEDERFVLIHVWVEVHPSLDERTIAANPVILATLVDQARSLADEIFKEKHPDATIHHHDMIADHV